MQANIPPDALVMRFTPVQAAAVLNKAAQEHRRTGHYRVSVFAAVARQGESVEAVEARLLRASELGHIDPASNLKYFTCRAGALLERGFTFWKYDDDPDELPEHYSVDLGDSPTLDDAGRFLGAFGPAHRRSR